MNALGNGPSAVNMISTHCRVRAFNVLPLERLVKDDLRSYTHNLKGIRELVPVETRT